MGFKLLSVLFEITRISLPVGTNGKPLAASGKFPNANVNYDW